MSDLDTAYALLGFQVPEGENAVYQIHLPLNRGTYDGSEYLYGFIDYRFHFLASGLRHPERPDDEPASILAATPEYTSWRDFQLNIPVPMLIE